MTDIGKQLSATALDGLVDDQRDELEGLRAAVRLCAAHLRSRSAAQMSRDEVAALLESMADARLRARFEAPHGQA